MTEISHRSIETNGIGLHVAECGPEDGPLVVMCHGFPELWYSWRHQLPALAQAGYRAVAPDQRGYGASSRPAAIADYDIHHLSDDILGLVNALGRDEAVVVGHDWGAPVVWHLAQRTPDRVRAVVGMSVPFRRRGRTAPIPTMRQLFGDRFFYQLYFQEPGVADADFEKDPREGLRRMMCAISGEAGPSSLGTSLPAEGTGVFEWLGPAETLPKWLTEADLDVFTAAFERSGFAGPINWYRNIDRNWQLTEPLNDTKVTVPALFIAGERDPVLAMAPVSSMDDWVTDLRGAHLLQGAGHWIQQERPTEVNGLLLEFLGSL